MCTSTIHVEILSRESKKQKEKGITKKKKKKEKKRGERS